MAPLGQSGCCRAGPRTALLETDIKWCDGGNFSRWTQAILTSGLLVCYNGFMRVLESSSGTKSRQQLFPTHRDIPSIDLPKHLDKYARQRRCVSPP